jgi:hypothetical protein
MPRTNNMKRPLPAGAPGGQPHSSQGSAAKLRRTDSRPDFGGGSQLAMYEDDDDALGLEVRFTSSYLHFAQRNTKPSLRSS